MKQKNFVISNKITTFAIENQFLKMRLKCIYK